MRSIVKLIQVVLIMVLANAGSTTAYAFVFPTVAQYVNVSERYTGDRWSEARTESWNATRNTVWRQCAEVLMSQGVQLSPLTSARIARIDRCEGEVAAVNNRTKASLGALKIDERIILPLTNYQIDQYEGRVVSASALANLKGQLEKLMKDFAEFRSKNYLTADQANERYAPLSIVDRVTRLEEASRTPPVRVLPEQDAEGNVLPRDTAVSLWSEDVRTWLPWVLVLFALIFLVWFIPWLIGTSISALVARSRSSIAGFRKRKEEKKDAKETRSDSDRIDEVERDLSRLKNVVGDEAEGDAKATGLHALFEGVLNVGGRHEKELHSIRSDVRKVQVKADRAFAFAAANAVFNGFVLVGDTREVPLTQDELEKQLASDGDSIIYELAPEDNPDDVRRIRFTRANHVLDGGRHGLKIDGIPSQRNPVAMKMSTIFSKFRSAAKANHLVGIDAGTAKRAA